METEYYIISKGLNPNQGSLVKNLIELDLKDINYVIINADKYDIEFDNHNLTRIKESDFILLKGVYDLIEKNVDCINISLGYNNKICLELEQLFQTIFEYATSKKIIPVIAVGNSGPNFGTMQILSRLKFNISVGATDENGILQDFSSRGLKNKFHPTFVANGIIGDYDKKRIKATLSPKARLYEEGTSFSAPIVTTIVCASKKLFQILECLMWKALNKKTNDNLVYGVMGFPDTSDGVHPSLIPPQVKEIIKSQKFEFDLSFQENEISWIRSIFEYIVPLGGTMEIVFSISKLNFFLQNICTQLNRYTIEEVGYGYLSRSSFINFVSDLTPKKFIKQFCTISGAQISQENIFIDINGRLFNKERSEYIISNCLYKQLIIAEKVK